jgi:predicted metal-dependent hydrolase
MISGCDASQRGTINPRPLRFAFDGQVPRFWHGDDPVRSHFFDALSTYLPVGEGFFVDSVRSVGGRIANAALREQIEAFIAQESAHGRQHREFNRLLAARGYGVESMEREHRAGVKNLKQRCSDLFRLALVVCAEHFTAILSRRLLAQPACLDGAHPEVAELWRWHAVEEIEHKAVAFDVYRAAGGGYWRRFAAMLVFTAGTLVDFPLRLLHMLRVDGRLGDLRMWLRAMSFMWISPAPLTRAIPDYLSFFGPGFHPCNRDDWPLIADHRLHYDRRAGEARAEAHEPAP